MGNDITTYQVEEQPVLSIRRRLTTEEMPTFIGQSCEKLYAYLGLLGVPPNGAPFVIYHAFGPGDIDAEVCAPTPHLVAGSAELEACVLAATTVARTVHLGPYDQLGTAYTALTEWVGDHGYETAGPPRERYLTEPGPAISSADYVTEIDLPVTPASVAVGVG